MENDKNRLIIKLSINFSFQIMCSPVAFLLGITLRYSLPHKSILWGLFFAVVIAVLSLAGLIIFKVFPLQSKECKRSYWLACTALTLLIVLFLAALLFI